MSNIFYTADGRKINLENFGDTQTTPPNSSTDSNNDKTPLKLNSGLYTTMILTDNGIMMGDNISGAIGKKPNFEFTGPMIYATHDGKQDKPRSLMLGASSGSIGILGNTTIQGDAKITGNMINDGTIKASKYLNADGSTLSGLPKNVSFDANGNMINDGTIKASKYLNADGSTLSGLPKNVSFDANGNIIFNGTIKASKYLNADGSEMKSSSSGCCIN